MATWGSTRRGCLGINAKRHCAASVDGNRALTPILYHSHMPRVPLAEFEPALSKKLEELWGTPPNLYRALGNQPRLVAAWAEFYAAVGGMIDAVGVQLEPEMREHSPRLSTK